MTRAFVIILAVLALTAALTGCYDTQDIVDKDKDRCTVGVFLEYVDGSFCLVSAPYYYYQTSESDKMYVIDCFETQKEQQDACAYLRMEMCGDGT